MIIAVDFDGTIVEHRYPEIGEEVPFATDTLRMLIKEHHRLILWSVREGQLLEDAVNWCKKRGVEFYAVNKDYPEEMVEYNNHFSRKIKADIFIDDRNLGGLPDWGQIYHMIHDHVSYRHLLNEARQQGIEATEAPKKRHWWQF
ncbi:BT0820 family HAD-type phosphatase [Prevotella sp. kh1p2]|uniref:BT0820 family HAD-type phosphatase n=1 Tax=Prevotella sp. kh1p2 TaxID=1761883 RepID=UPI0008ADDE86|nr:hypothetical protein [Prevotella sp. kh1p2]SET11730.1 hypothetical protein SAMN04487825_114100 [Prevotella sp. kh1p2]SNU11794.1 hypothetical protein SAMN06298210_1144 [Prevotellaceae bacterium KH2P17]